MGFSVTFEECAGYPKPEWRMTNLGWRFVATRCMRGAWSDLGTYLNELTTYPNNAYPYSHGTEAALVRRVKPTGEGKITSTSGTLISYTTALVYVTYDTEGPAWEPGSLGNYLKETLRRGAYGAVFPPTGATWSDRTTSVNSSQSLEYTTDTVEYVRTFYDVNGIPPSVYSLVGYANAAPVSTYQLGISFPLGTLQYMGPQVEAVTNLGEIPSLTVSEVFAYRANGWNSWWNPEKSGAAGWDTVKQADGTAWVPHPPGNFALLG